MSRFEAVTTFIDAAMIVCDYPGDMLGLLPTFVLLHLVAGPAILAVDNEQGLSDELRRFMLTRQYWEVNPLIQRLRERLSSTSTDSLDFGEFTRVGRSCGYPVPERHVSAVPILGRRGWLGKVMFGHDEPLSRECERNAAMLVMFLATWCAQHGIAAVPDASGTQLRVRMRAAKLAARGFTNSEIGEQLAISTNTVKAHLKHVYERLGARSRLEPVDLLRRLAPLDEAPPGITQRARVTITRSRPSRSRITTSREESR